jgi:hypothetical protein
MQINKGETMNNQNYASLIFIIKLGDKLDKKQLIPKLDKLIRDKKNNFGKVYKDDNLVWTIVTFNHNFEEEFIRLEITFSFDTSLTGSSRIMSFEYFIFKLVSKENIVFYSNTKDSIFDLETWMKIEDLLE